MKKKYVVVLFLSLILSIQSLIGCTGENSKKENTVTEESKDGQVASAEELGGSKELEADGLKEITGDKIKNGVYEIEVDSSSSMFRIEACELTVKDGKMTAAMTMGGTGYLKVYMGTGEEAAKASEEDYISYEENELGQHTYTVPVEALDKVVYCAAYSKDREKWYDRTLIFRASSIDAAAFEEGVVTTVESLDLEDGTYIVEVSLEGGTGKASIDSPAKMNVENGTAYIEIGWSSPNYDYMKYEGQRYELADQEGNSNFILPISVFDWSVAVIADTTAMSEPHEITYTIVLNSKSIEKTTE